MKITIETNGANSILNVTHVITLPEAFSAIRFHSRFNQDFWLTSSSSQSHHDYNYLKYAFTESIFCACGELIKNTSRSNVQIKRLSTFAIGMIVKNNVHEPLFAQMASQHYVQCGVVGFLFIYKMLSIFLNFIMKKILHYGSCILKNTYF